LPTARICRFALITASLLTAAASPSLADPLPPPLIQDTPLVLKDGRMAYVTVRAVPFERGADTLSTSVAEGVAAAAAEIATDCFLTAQAIGHVEPGAQGEGDTLASHRLARARAERVQEALSLHGIPASAVASVWDWQFLVREPRVTLWIFRMRQGEDCQGVPLPGSTSPAPAASPQIVQRTTPAEQEVAAEAPAPAPQEMAAVAPSAAPAPEPPTAERPTPLAASAPPERAPAAVRLQGPVATMPLPPRPAEPVPEEPPPVIEALQPPPPPEPPPAFVPAEAPPPPAAEPILAEAPLLAPELEPEPTPPPMLTPAPTASIPATPPSEPPPPPPPKVTAKAEPPTGPVAAEEGIELVFDNNSSFLPESAARQLKQWVRTLPRAGGYKVEIAAAVGGADVKAGGDPAQAARYARWLADRRLGRVAEWLEKNVQARDLQMQRRFLENDGSRRVVIRVSPVT
jgi:hypothetical protein